MLFEGPLTYATLHYGSSHNMSPSSRTLCFTSALHYRSSLLIHELFITRTLHHMLMRSTDLTQSGSRVWLWLDQDSFSPSHLYLYLLSLYYSGE